MRRRDARDRRALLSLTAGALLVVSLFVLGHRPRPARPAGRPAAPGTIGDPAPRAPRRGLAAAVDRAEAEDEAEADREWPERAAEEEQELLELEDPEDETDAKGLFEAHQRRAADAGDEGTPALDDPEGEEFRRAVEAVRAEPEGGAP